jgi:hypothetical protein
VRFGGKIRKNFRLGGQVGEGIFKMPPPRPRTAPFFLNPYASRTNMSKNQDNVITLSSRSGGGHWGPRPFRLFALFSTSGVLVLQG